MGLSDLLSGCNACADTTLLQSTNYWKNASQQGLPFTLNPAVLYRGYIANTLNNGFCVMSQFYLNGEQPTLLWPSSHSFRIASGLSGLVKKALLGDANRELTDPEKIVAGISSGALSGIVSTQPPGAWRTSQLKGVVCGPMELVMIQQQRKGTHLLETTWNMIKAGPFTFFRGTGAMMAREGVYAGGFLGLMPVMREWRPDGRLSRAQVRKTFPDSAGKSDDSARFTAAMVAGMLP
ncbi:MAG: hypothetical protein SGPRY_005270 [Prymnesium sp.]